MWNAWLAARRAGRDVAMPPFAISARASPPEQLHAINDVAPTAALVAPSPAPRRRPRSPSYTYAQIVTVLGPKPPCGEPADRLAHIELQRGGETRVERGLLLGRPLRETPTTSEMGAATVPHALV